MSTIIRSAVGSVAAIGFLELLREMDFRVIGTDITRQVVGRIVTDEFYVVPKAALEDEVIESYNNITSIENAYWIISGPETEVGVLIKNRDRLKAKVFHLPLETFKLFTDKSELHRVLFNIGIKTPIIFSAETEDYKRSKSSKLVLKPKKGRGSAGVYIVEKGEIELYLNMLGDKRKSYLIQEYVDGKEISVDTLHDFTGKILNIVARYRLNTESGISTVSQTFRDNKIFETIKELSNQFSFYGANCIQFIQDTVTKEYYLTDVNPRFGGGSILSLKASETMRNNLRLILNNDDSGYVYESCDYDSLTMLRGFNEFYK